jgi:general secretion pathway protein J
MIAEEEGFTVAELLVALAVAAVVLGLASGGIRTAARVGDASAAIERATALAAARQTLAECIESSLPLSEVDGEGRVRLAFSGSAEQLALVCPLAGLRRVVLGTRSIEGRHYLVLDEMPFSQHKGAAPPHAHILAEDVVGLSIRYLGEDSDGRAPAWRPEWSGSESAPPLLVAIRLSFPEGDRRRWPELVVRPRSSTQ